MKPEERPGILLGIAFVAFLSYWVVAPAVFQIFSGHKLIASSQPGNQSIESISPHDLIALSSTAPVIGLISLFAGHTLWRSSGLKRAGFRTDGSVVISSLLSIVVIIPLMFGVMWLTEKFWTAIQFKHPTEHDLLKILGNESNPMWKVGIIISAVVLAPLFEEFFFRGTLQAGLSALFGNSKGPRWLAILLASICFTAVHGALWLAPPIFFLSICLGFAYDRSRNLWVPIAVHSVFNATSVILFLLLR
jgi:membrane protease YdiL (CAAX protease family)